MAGLLKLVTIISGSCLVSNLFKWHHNPWCASIRGQDKNEIAKALLMAPVSAPAMTTIEGAQEVPYRLQPEEESALFEALAMIVSIPGLTTMSEVELDSYLAGLDAPEPTTMLTVATNTSTMQPST